MIEKAKSNENATNLTKSKIQRIFVQKSKIQWYFFQDPESKIKFIKNPNPTDFWKSNIQVWLNFNRSGSTDFSDLHCLYAFFSGIKRKTRFWCILKRLERWRRLFCSIKTRALCYLWPRKKKLQVFDNIRCSLSCLVLFRILEMLNVVRTTLSSACSKIHSCNVHYTPYIVEHIIWNRTVWTV